jgi:ribose-phosphate pyrophosphokinase
VAPATPLLIPLPGNERLAAQLAELLGAELGSALVRRFPDGESYVRLEQPVRGRELILACTLHRPPDDKFLPLAFLAATARELGASSVGLVAPYLSYMRQDRRFEDGEGVTSAYFARLLSQSFDWLVTVDPHLHRRSAIADIYAIPAAEVHAASAVSAWIREHVTRPLLIGPDEESAQWVRSVAEEVGAPHLVLEKTRRGDEDVSVSVPDVGAWSRHTPVLVDDIISTAHTMIEPVQHLRRLGLAPPVCVGIHAVFAEGALEQLLAAGVSCVATTDTIPHSTNQIAVAPLIAEGVRTLRSRNSATARTAIQSIEP